ncbi:hypothetical protein [Nocardioides limicola]|uniref:hypothetical protein n=1 Tax=Nocardioides limicola TaxID=2803368 RepID=UPI00193B0C23|nr:hypothetical protein [Nocardioides sp. DJM-14]
MEHELVAWVVTFLVLIPVQWMISRLFRGQHVVALVSWKTDALAEVERLERRTVAPERESAIAVANEWLASLQKPTP